jgi:hypothetical protein
MNTGEQDSYYNNGIKPVVDNLYELRRLEFSDDKLKIIKAKKIIKRVLIDLTYKNNYVLYRPMLEELHDRMVFYYDELNMKNLSAKIPIFRVTMHNEMFKWWQKCDKLKKSTTLIHCDFHDDMSLPEVGGKKMCSKINYPVTCLLSTGKIDHVIWAIDKGVKDDNNSFRQVLRIDPEYGYLRLKSERKDNFILIDDVTLVDNIKLKNTDIIFTLDRLHVEKLNGWKNMVSMISGDNFILDIDLDFFVCNGEKNVSLNRYKRDFTDLASEGRVVEFPDMITPRMMFTDDESINVINDLSHEFKLLNKRLKTFCKGLKFLKSRGKTPCCISICDSVGSLFSGNSSRAIFTNEYSVKYFVPYMHMFLLQNFKDLYNLSITV